MARSLTAAVLRDSFSYFVRAAWPVIEQDTLIEGFFLDCVTEYLMALAMGWGWCERDGRRVKKEMKRLVINCPPRMGKSTFCNVIFPCWIWAFDGGRTKFLFATATEELAVRDSVRRRNLILSPWYQNLFGDTFQIASDMNMKHHYVTTAGGECYSTFVGGATGRGCDVLVIDDPHRPLEDMETAINYCRQSLFTRLNNPAHGRILVIMQRLAIDDLSGVLLEGFDELPAKVEPEPPEEPKPDPYKGFEKPINVFG